MSLLHKPSCRISFPFAATLLSLAIVPHQRVAAAEPDAGSPARTTVFQLSEEHGVRHGYRIPALVVAENDTLCAFCERRVGLRDHAENDIVLRRSTDAGKNWKPIQVVAEAGADSLNDPCVVRLRSGQLLLRYTRFPKGVHASVTPHTVMAEPGYEGPKVVRVYLTESSDHGATWSRPRDVTRLMRREQAVSLGSPGTGIVLMRGPNRDRIVFPNYEVYHLGEGKRKTANSVCYSDDGGITWRLSATIAEDSSANFGDEAQLVELAEGGILLTSRDEPHGTCRKIAISRDGGETWSSHRIAHDLQTPPCMSSVVRFSWPDGEKPGILLHTLPHTADRRSNGTIMISRDEGATWSPGKVIEPGSFAYSCLARLPGGDFGCLYETDDHQRIVFRRLRPDELF